MDALTTIRRRRAEIAHALEALASEDRDLATTEHVLERLERGGETPARGEVAKLAPPAPRRARGQNLRPRSQREFVIDVLSRAEQPWMRTSEIVQTVQRQWGEEIPELSLRPLLTALKKSRIIVRQGRVVALRERTHDARPVEARAPRAKNARR